MSLETDTGGLAIGNSFVFSNARNAQTSAYSVAASDQGATVALGGNAFYQLTVGAASGFAANFLFIVVNEDTGRGKTIALNGGETFILWPGQSIIVFNQNSTWQTIGRRRWKLPAGVTNLYVDPSLGNNSNDGLAAGAGAFQSLNAVIQNLINDQFDGDGGTSSTLIVINVTGTDTSLVHWSPHPGGPGYQGYNAIVVDGGGTATLAGDGVGSSVFQLFAGAVLAVQNITIAPSLANGNCVEVYDGAAFTLGVGVTFISNNSGVYAARGGIGYLGGNGFTLSKLGAGGAMLVAVDGGVISHSGGTVTLGANVTAAQYANATRGGAISVSGVTYNLNGHTFTGSQVFSGANGAIFGAAAMFGSGATLSSGGVTDSFPNNVSAGYTGATSFTSRGIVYGQGGGALAASTIGVTKTGNYTVTAADHLSSFDNNGAAGSVTFTLPAAAAGLRYRFCVMTVQTLQVTANGTDKIAVAASNSAAGGHITNATPFSVVELEAHGTGQWFATQTVGTWTVT